MSWGLFLALVWGLATTAAWSRAAAPPRRVLVALLEAVEGALSLKGPWLSTGPCCPACIAFWVGLGLTWAGHGPPAAPLVAGFIAYGATLLLAAAFKRLALGTDL